jgi:hypothetical protein
MKKYVEIGDNEKLNLLNEHSIGNWKSLEEKKWCLHCESQFTGRSVRVYKDKDPGLWLECGTPDCDGSPIDWADYPWWDGNHPKTKAQDAAMTKFDRVIAKAKKPERN